MKKLTVIAMATFLFCSCNGADTNEKTADEGALQPNVENVNGNMPETENTITLDTRDSTAKNDSLKQ
jgi:hypothetical protein